MYLHFTEHRIHARHASAFEKDVIAAARRAIASQAACFRVDLMRDMDDAGLFRICEVYADRRGFESSEPASAAGPARRKWYSARSRPPLRAQNLFPGDASLRKAKKNPLPAAPLQQERYVHWNAWPIKPKHRAEWIAATTKNARTSARTEWGCYRFDVLQDLDDRNRFYLYQLYHDRWFHDEIHANKIHVGRLRANPGWIHWTDRSIVSPIGRRSTTQLSWTIRGALLWSNETLAKPGRGPKRPEGA